MSEIEKNELGNPTEGTLGFRKRALKACSIAEVEAVIGKALRELTGQDFDVDVRQLDLNPEPHAVMTDAATMNLYLRRKVVRDQNSPFGF